MLPAKKAITERPAQQRGQGRALGCPRSITAPWHGGALCLSFPICRRGLGAGAVRAARSLAQGGGQELELTGVQVYFPI